MSAAKENFREVKIPVPWGEICGKWWGPRGRQPVLALHGWQDNAGSFDTLAPLLPDDISLLAIDMPGHGFSSHYPAGQFYYLFWDGVLVVRRVAKHFRWNKISIIGHSMGGAIGFLYAAAYPSEVDKLICIDIASPTIKDTESLASITGTVVDRFLKYETLSEDAMPCYSYSEMVNLVVDAYQGSVTRPSAEIIVKRGMTKAPESSARKNEDGYLFSRDLRLKVAGLGLISLDLVLEYARRITCQYMNIKGVPGMCFDRPEFYTQVLETIKQSACRYEYHEIPGTHHLHLNTPERVLPVILKFLTTDVTEESVNGTTTSVAPDPAIIATKEPTFPGGRPNSTPPKETLFPATKLPSTTTSKETLFPAVPSSAPSTSPTDETPSTKETRDVTGAGFRSTMNGAGANEDSTKLSAAESNGSISGPCVT